VVRLTGRALTAAGFGAPYDQPVTLRLSCLSTWCADPPLLNEELLITLKHEDDARVIEVSACPGNALPFIPDDEARIMNCHRFENCETADF